MSELTQSQIQWLAPAPLWPRLAAQPATHGEMRRPQILRFAGDNFMDEYLAMLQHQPERLGEWQARPETWQGPAGDPVPVAKLPPMVQRLQRLRLATATPANLMLSTLSSTQSGTRLKLYQPGHGRFYLVTGCLVCRQPGMPDRAVRNGAGERTTYVVRRLRPKAGAPLPAEFNVDTCDEYAFVEGQGWQRAAADALVPNEEQLPLFGVSYTEGDGRRRRILGAAIPVGKRETYVGAPAAPILANPPNVAAIDPRKAIFMRQVSDPWRSIITQVQKAAQGFKASAPPGLEPSEIDSTEQAKANSAADAQAVWLSWLILSDFSHYLEKYLPAIWDVITGTAPEASLDDEDARNLYAVLRDTTYTDPHTGPKTLAAALRDIRNLTTDLDAITEPYSADKNAAAPPAPFPAFRFRLHHATLAALVNGPTPDANATAAERPADVLDDWVDAALPNDSPPNTPPLPLAAGMTTLDQREPVWFMIRFVFAQPNCEPLASELLSEPSVSFQMASFFDPQAPARPIRIALPLDTSPAGLRKFDKNTAFMISDVLCGQMQRVRSLSLGDLVMSVLPWPLHKDLAVPDGGACADDGISFGMICSFSIPIITICALILLMIIVSLLDIIFRWIPFFITCFPLPNFSGKDD